MGKPVAPRRSPEWAGGSIRRFAREETSWRVANVKTRICILAILIAAMAVGLIGQSRAIDWSQAGVPGGIPTRTTICATIAPEGSASAPVAPTDVVNAIASCPAGQVVFLEPGSYYFSSGIDFTNHSNVTLRGAGADQTLLHFSGTTGCTGFGTDLCISNGTTTYSGGGYTQANWTAGYAPGTTQITLDNTSGIVAGHTLLILDQLNDSNTDNGGIWINDTQGVAEDDNPSNGYRPGRSQEQVVLATAVSGNTVTISPGLYMPNWRASQSPQAWWSKAAVMGDGIEDLSIDNGGNNGIGIVSGYGNWVSGVRSIMGGMQHVLLYLSAHNTIQNSYFYGTKDASTESYGYNESGGSDNLIINNIFQHIVASVLTGGASVGTVVAYNFSIDQFDSAAGVNAYMMGAYQPHSAGEALWLFEGNVGDQFAADDTHGTGYLYTLFRNWLEGWDPAYTDTNDTVAVAIDTFHRYFNVVGNVLGWAGYTKTYQIAAPAGTNQDLVSEIYNLGWSNYAGFNVTDVLTSTTLFRWGNYDVVNGSAQWNPAEVPASLSQLANPLPTTQTLPASFFLNSMPAFWVTPFGTPPWPAIGPDVTGGDSHSGGFANAIPAELCYQHATPDPDYPAPTAGTPVLVFNAGKCYGQPPAPPSNLTATVQ